MNVSVRLRREAESDLAEAAAWYECQRPGLGRDFLNEVEGMLESIASRPASYPQVYRSVHRAIIKRFPFSVFYLVVGVEVVVLAVLHSTRDPSKWQGRR